MSTALALALALCGAGGPRSAAPDVASTLVPLHARVLESAAPRLAMTWAAAARAVVWADGADPAGFALCLAAGREAVVAADASGAALPIDPCLARSLASLSAAYDAEDHAAVRPEAPGEVRAALLHASSREALCAVFSHAHEGPAVSDRTLGIRKPFEPGGMAYLEPGTRGTVVRLIGVLDPVHALVRDLAGARTESARLLAIWRRNPFQSLAADAQGLLSAALERIEPGQPVDERLGRRLALVLETISANVADSYGLDEGALVQALADLDPPLGRGARALGAWHGHPGPPRGAPPSDEDRQVAAARGRFLTFVEEPGGFVAYDVTRDDPWPEALALGCR